MSVAANEDQTAFWNGEVGQRWARNQAILDRAFASLTAAQLDRAAPRPGERVAAVILAALAIARARSPSEIDLTVLWPDWLTRLEVGLPIRGRSSHA